MGNLYQFSPQEDYDQALLRFMQAELLSWDRIESDSFGTRLKGLVTRAFSREGAEPAELDEERRECFRLVHCGGHVPKGKHVCGACHDYIKAGQMCAALPCGDHFHQGCLGNELLVGRCKVCASCGMSLGEAITQAFARRMEKAVLNHFQPQWAARHVGSGG